MLERKGGLQAITFLVPSLLVWSSVGAAVLLFVEIPYRLCLESGLRQLIAYAEVEDGFPQAWQSLAALLSLTGFFTTLSLMHTCSAGDDPFGIVGGLPFYGTA